MRWFGYTADAAAGGSNEEAIAAAAGAIPDATEFVPVTTAQPDPGLNQLERNDEVRGRRANTAPISFASAPSMTFGARAYPKLCRRLVRNVLGGAITSTGTAPAAIESTVQPLQDGNLPAIVGTLLREGQTDRMTGLVVEELALNFPVDEEGSVDVTLQGLYHRVNDTATLTPPAASYPGYVDTFMLRDAKAFLGTGAGVQITCLAGFGFTYNNGLIDDFRSRFCAGRNIEDTVIDTVRHRMWYPDRHKLGPQQVTGRLDFGEVRPSTEQRRILAHAEKLVFEVAAGPLGTTPAADEMMRLTLYKQASTGGGAEPLQREGDQVSSYEFTAYLDADGTNKDVEATFVGTTALT